MKAVRRLKRHQMARNYRLLRKRSVTVRKTIDAVIATRCIAGHLGLRVVE